MNVVLVGYGRMGRLIEQILADRGHRTARRIDAAGSPGSDGTELTPEVLADADGVVEFALADGVLDRLALYAEAGVAAVVGTTGWDHHVDEAKALFSSGSGALLKGSNFSVGAHLFFRLSRAAARLVNPLEEYDASLLEYHHNRKADAPSGTALTAAAGVLEELDRKSHLVTDLPEGPIEPDGLHVASVRVGQVPGIHELRLDSAADFVTVRHEARHRGGFALGAVRGLEWLSGRRGWHEADEFIDDLLTGTGGTT